MVSRRSFLSASAAALGVPAPGPAAPRGPNFIVFLTDDHGCTDLGCYGASDLQTPHIDALASGGVRFTNWYSNAPVCAPSRGALMTGRYPQRNGLVTNGAPLRPSERSVAALLKERGYRTAITGKWHLGGPDTPESVPNAHGFDYFFGFHSGCIDYYSHRYYWGEPRRVNYHDLYRNRDEIFEDGQYMTEMISREARRFVAQPSAGPFFLYVPFNGVHYPMHAPKRYLDRFPAAMDPERRTYAAMLAAVDDAVGEILGTVRKTGQLENTLVFFLADNGATREPRAGLNQKPATAGRNGVYRGWKFSLFDGGMHVPGIVSWPGRVPARTVGELAMTADVLPTVLAAAGVPLPGDRTYDGRDILPVARGVARSQHEAIFWSSEGQLAVRRGNWKLVKDGFIPDGTPEGRKRLQGEDALFLSDLESDPGETTNRRRQHPEVVDDLLTSAEQWLGEVKN